MFSTNSVNRHAGFGPNSRVGMGKRPLVGAKYFKQKDLSDELSLTSLLDLQSLFLCYIGWPIYQGRCTGRLCVLYELGDSLTFFEALNKDQ